MGPAHIARDQAIFRGQRADNRAMLAMRLDRTDDRGCAQVGQSFYLWIISTGMQYGFDQDMIRFPAKTEPIDHDIGQSTD